MLIKKTIRILQRFQSEHFPKLMQESQSKVYLKAASGQFSKLKVWVYKKESFIQQLKSLFNFNLFFAKYIYISLIKFKKKYIFSYSRVSKSLPSCRVFSSSRVFTELVESVYKLRCPWMCCCPLSQQPEQKGPKTSGQSAYCLSCNPIVLGAYYGCHRSMLPSHHHKWPNILTEP